MKIELFNISVKELTSEYNDRGEEGITGFNGKLDIRPPYQREFIYNEKQRKAVIDTVFKNHPLNVMYWAVRDDNGFEIIDGQQRTISLCQYVNGDFSYNARYFHNLEEDEKNTILDYSLMIYQCSGSPSDKLEWFRIINIAGEILTAQELRNATYHGLWVSDAKRYFSKIQCPAYKIGNKYLKGKSNRQEYLEKAIEWISNDSINDYMANNQHNESAVVLWDYFHKVISWVEILFPHYRSLMKGIEWGKLYNTYRDNNTFVSNILENKVKELIIDDEVQNNKGIYYYIFDGKEKHLNIRTFSIAQKSAKYEIQNGICSICNNQYGIDEMEGDHIKPWSEGGTTKTENLQMLCKDCNRTKSNK